MGRMGRLLAMALFVGCGRVNFGPVAVADAKPDGAVGSAQPWALVQTAASATQALVIAPSASGHLIVVAVQLINLGTVTSIKDDGAGGGNTYVAIPTARATNTNPMDAVELWYAKSSVAGAGAIQVMASQPVSAVAAWEVSGIRTDNPVDTASVLDSQPGTTTPLGPNIATSVAGDFIVSVAIVANGVIGAHTGNEFINDHSTRGNGWAHLSDPGSAPGNHQAQWDQDIAGPYCATAAAFQVAP